MSRPLPHPHTVLGYRRDGRPIHPVLGAAEDDPSNEQNPEKTFTQAEVTSLLAREKQQGSRAGVNDVLSKLGFDKIDDLAVFVQSQKDAQAAQLSEVERREQAAVAREQAAVARERAAEAKERAAQWRTSLVGLGAVGEDLTDAEALLRATVAKDADAQTVADAAEALKVRRPNLFGGRQESAPPAPGGSPAGGPPPRGDRSPKTGSIGMDMARRRGYISE